jgi:hypothetical protein
MKVALSDSDQQNLRENQIISEHEVAFRVGDLYVAENILSGQRRQINVGNLITEQVGKKILKG